MAFPPRSHARTTYELGSFAPMGASSLCFPPSIHVCPGFRQLRVEQVALHSWTPGGTRRLTSRLEAS